MSTLARLVQSSVVVTTHGGNSGSGTIVAHGKRSSYVLTCDHVGGRYTTMEVTSAREGVFHTLKGTIVARDEAQDLALVRVPSRIPQPALPIAKREPEMYDNLYVMGSPGGCFGTAGRALLVARDNSNNKGDIMDAFCRQGMGAKVRKANLAPDALYSYTGLCVPGMSGGTLANELGELVGVPMAVFADGHLLVYNLGFAVSLPTIRKFLTWAFRSEKLNPEESK